MSNAQNNNPLDKEAETLFSVAYEQSNSGAKVSELAKSSEQDFQPSPFEVNEEGASPSSLDISLGKSLMDRDSDMTPGDIEDINRELQSAPDDALDLAETHFEDEESAQKHKATVVFQMLEKAYKTGSDYEIRIQDPDADRKLSLTGMLRDISDAANNGESDREARLSDNLIKLCSSADKWTVEVGYGASSIVVADWSVTRDGNKVSYQLDAAGDELHEDMLNILKENFSAIIECARENGAKTIDVSNVEPYVSLFIQAAEEVKHELKVNVVEVKGKNKESEVPKANSSQVSDIPNFGNVKIPVAEIMSVFERYNLGDSANEAYTELFKEASPDSPVPKADVEDFENLLTEELKAEELAKLNVSSSDVDEFLSSFESNASNKMSASMT